MLATAENGAQTEQSFVVTYADGSTKTFLQSLSDWFTPGGYAGETKAVIMGYRNQANGTKDQGTFYLYGYSFSLDSTKVVQSIQFPNNSHVVVVALSLVPDYQPQFVVNPFNEASAPVAQAYSGTVATNAFDLNSTDPLTFAVVSGPAWLTVAANGALSGTPSYSDIGSNSFVISVTDPGGLSGSATLNINVTSVAPAFTAFQSQGTNLTLAWAGGNPPYHVEMSTNLAPGSWTDISGPIDSNTLVVVPSNAAAFYQITGQ
jgi:hypothetical protein